MIRSGKLNRGSWVSRSALGIALALGMVGGTATIGASPALAQKNQAPKITPSKGFVAVAAPAQEAIDSADAADTAAIADARAKLDQAFAAIESADDRFMAGSLAVNLGGKAKDAELQLKGVQAMIESGKADAGTLPKLLAAGGQLAYQAKNYALAQQYLQQAVDAGASDRNMLAMLGEAYLANNQLDRGLNIFESAISQGKASGQLAPDSWYRRGLLAAYKAQNLPKATDFGVLLISDYPTPQNIGVAATVVRELGRFAPQETLDLMRLMGRTNSYAEEHDYIEYIQAADSRRLPGEVLTVIESGIASGKLQPSNSFVTTAKSEASARVAADKAALASYERDARASGANAATVTGTADAFLSYGQAAKAEELYRIALGKPGVDAARVHTRLGIAQVDQGKYAAAQESFAKVTGKSAPIAKLWAAYAASKASPAPATAAAQ